ncbi:MAG: hypothetical protein ACJ707_10405 [Nitrososphaera sp.]
MERFFNPELTLDNIYERIGKTIAKRPLSMSQTTSGLDVLQDLGPGGYRVSEIN